MHRYTGIRSVKLPSLLTLRLHDVHFCKDIVLFFFLRRRYPLMLYSSCCNAAYLSLMRVRRHNAISEVAADWQELLAAFHYATLRVQILYTARRHANALCAIKPRISLTRN